MRDFVMSKEIKLTLESILMDAELCETRWQDRVVMEFGAKYGFNKIISKKDLIAFINKYSKDEDKILRWLKVEGYISEKGQYHIGQRFVYAIDTGEEFMLIGLGDSRASLLSLKTAKIAFSSYSVNVKNQMSITQEEFEEITNGDYVGLVLKKEDDTQ